MILLNPGPVSLSAKVRRALQAEDLCHREPEFAALTKAILEKLESVYRGAAQTHAAVLLTASGSGAVEAMLSTFAPRNSTTLVVANGVYGERMLDMLTRQGKPCIGLTGSWESPIELESVERLLAEHPDISHLAVVHHETTTGRLNELSAIAKLCAERQIELMIDAVSSFGAEWLDFEVWNPLAIASTANKCLHGVPGVSFVMARRETLEHSQTQATTLYFDLLRYYRDQRSGWSPFTQAVQGFMALDAALDELLDSGSWSARREVYRQRSARIATRLARLGAQPLLAEGASSMLRSYLYPEGKSYTPLHDGLKKRGFTIYAGQGPLQARIFRIATMGEIGEEDMLSLMNALTEVLG
ncbi:aminotransferase class V-fold PLP-dependent enzyme [Niveibacterium terrae]|uniref:aminotransferase class V-fold PLP-dependent enzyme n=1 Tax=Niveibacterium terrae TaxID=3373598 RepID=UPI003A913C3E